MKSSAKRTISTTLPREGALVCISDWSQLLPTESALSGEPAVGDAAVLEEL